MIILLWLVFGTIKDLFRYRRGHKKTVSLLIFPALTAAGIGTGSNELLPRLQRASPSTSLDKINVYLIHPL